MNRQRGAAMLVLIAVLFAVMAAAAVAALRPMARQHTAAVAQQRSLALARDALHGAALARHCTDATRPLDTLIPCPEGATEGTAAASCAGVTRGWLPWRTLGLPPARDSSGTCLWFERQGATGRVIAPQAARTGQNRASLASRLVCGGNLTAASYLDATDPAVAVAVNLAPVSATCP